MGGGEESAIWEAPRTAGGDPFPERSWGPSAFTHTALENMESLIAPERTLALRASLAHQENRWPLPLFCSRINQPDVLLSRPLAGDLIPAPLLYFQVSGPLFII